MKRVALIILTLVSTFTCLGQSLFFDDLSNSQWKADADYNDSTIRTSKEIGLGKIVHSTDSLRVNVTLWAFNDGTLTIKYYDWNINQDSLLAIYQYRFNDDKGTLDIIFNDNETFEYEVGIVSTGSYALLTRKKEKKKK